MIKRLIVLLLILTAVSAVWADRRPYMIDSLTTRLSTLTTPRDSLATYFDILDLSVSRTDRRAICEKIYSSAVNARDTFAIIESIVYEANVAQLDSAMLQELRGRLELMTPSDATREAELFIDLFQVENVVRADEQSESRRMIPQLIRELDSIKDNDLFVKVRVLYALCFYLAQETHGALLEKYIRKLTAMVEVMPLPMGWVRNFVYNRAAPVFTRNGSSVEAVKIDKQTLAVIDSLAAGYEARGRKFRKLDINRYLTYRRLLSNYKALSTSEIDTYYNAIVEIAAQNDAIARDRENNPRGEAFYHMSKGDYDKALKDLRKAISATGQEVYVYFLWDAMLEAATHTGDRSTQLEALQKLNGILKKQIETKAGDRYRELQIVYDVDELEYEKNELERSRHMVLSSNSRILLTVTIIGLALILVLGGLLLVQKRRMNALSDNLSTTAKGLEKERSDLSNARTELLAIRDKVQAADRVKTDFINNMSQEIVTPLTAVTEYTRLIVDCIPDDKLKYLAKYVDIIDLNTKLVLSLINDVLDVASVENDRMAISRKPTSVRKISELVVSSFRETIKTRSENLSLLFNEDEVPDINVETDARRVVQVLLNLLDNAAKFTEQGFIKFEVHADYEDARLVFSIADSGIGIPAGKEEKIFERFYQIDSAARGSGLGLYISRLIARLLGGTIEVDKDYRKGSRFIFTLPL